MFNESKMKEVANFYLQDSVVDATDIQDFDDIVNIEIEHGLVVNINKAMKDISLIDVYNALEEYIEMKVHPFYGYSIA